jgi:putative methionine-R-sulfoxide reductase with GAF domain
VTDQDNKPVLDEQTFEKLLRAGYVIQEHGRKMRELEARMESHSERLREQESANQAPLPIRKPASEETSRTDGDYTLTLAEIVEAQHQIQVRHLDLDKAMAVIAEKVARIAGATGAGIGILDEKIVRYRGGAGTPALPVGSEVPLATAVCAASVRTGHVIRSEDVNTEVLFDPEPCRERGILSLVAVPIYHDGDIVGGLELYFDRIRGYAEQDIHTCQLMAGLVTEAIGRDADSKVKKSMAAERSTMLAAIEKLKPNLAALAEDQSAAAAKTNVRAGAAAAAKSPCWKCGNPLLAEEQFCGTCGAPRNSASEPSSMQSKLASAWHMQQSQQNLIATPPNGASHLGEMTRPVAHQENDAEVKKDRTADVLLEPYSRDLEELDPLSSMSFAASADEDAMAAALSSKSALGDNEDNVEAAATALVKPRKEDVVWSSAAKAREFLESLSGKRTPSGKHTPSALVRFWNSRRGDFYLAVAVILVVAVIRWGIWSNPAVGATSHGTAVSGSTDAHKQPAPDADVSTFDKLLISLGLAEAPQPPEYKGNPDTQVWIDLQTALYYCPGSDLYGKTPKGRLASQRDAQLDQFEPSNRKPCD